MSTQKIQLTKGEYIQVSSDEDAGSVFHLKGGHVLFHQAATQPSNDAVPMENIDQRYPRFPYFGLGSEHLYAKAVDDNTEISITPAQKA